MKQANLSISLISVTPQAEHVIEKAGRIAYGSDVSSMESTGRFLKMIIGKGHESVIEHAVATFRIEGVSRALTHQLVRHRLCAFTQRSQRYVDEGEFSVVVPPSIKDAGLVGEFISDMEIISRMYDKYKTFGIKNEDARFVLPNACETKIVHTANFREWRHIIGLRTSPHAQWEIRELCRLICVELNVIAPNIFGDLMEQF